MPTHAVPEYVPDPEPDGTDGFGTVNVPTTELKVEPAGGAVKTTPAQLEEYSVGSALISPAAGSGPSALVGVPAGIMGLLRALELRRS